MNEIVDLIILSAKTGAIYSLAVLGFSLSFRFLGYADLTLEGTFVLGGTLSAFVLSRELNPWITIPLAALLGIFAGLVTASQHCFLKVNRLLSGIITLAALYTVNLRIVGRPNVSLYDTTTIFSGFFDQALGQILLIVLIVATIFILVYRFLLSNFGLFLRATGENQRSVSAAGYDHRIFILVGIAISNALIAVSGALFAQYQGFSDINSGAGIIVVTLTSLIIGETLLRPTTVGRFILAVLVGSWMFHFVVGACLRFGLNPWDYKALIALLLIIMVSAKRFLLPQMGANTIGTEVF